MKPDPNYPRWMFHRTRPMVCVNNQEEERALGAEWSRTMPVAEPPRVPPAEQPPVQPPQEPDEPEEEEPEEPDESEDDQATPAKPHRTPAPVRPPVPRKRAATKSHKR